MNKHHHKIVRRFSRALLYCTAALLPLCTSLTNDNGLLPRDNSRPDSSIEPSFVSPTAQIFSIPGEPSAADTIRLTIGNPSPAMSFGVDPTWIDTQYTSNVLTLSIPGAALRTTPDTTVTSKVYLKIGSRKIDSCAVTITVGRFIFTADSGTISRHIGSSTADTIRVNISNQVAGMQIASPDPWLGWTTAQSSVKAYVIDSLLPSQNDTTLYGRLVLMSGIRPVDTLSIKAVITVTAVIPGIADSAMKLIPSASKTFIMGSNLAIDKAAPPHPVTFTYSFWIDSTEVTLRHYLTVMKTNPSTNTTMLSRPIDQVTWYDAVLYCNARSILNGLDTVYRYSSITGTPGKGCTDLANLAIDYNSRGYRLPTEAEWEFACRATTTTNYYWGDSFDERYGMYGKPSTNDVAQLKPNQFGLYDMSGNIAEWCNDIYQPYPQTTSPVTDPVTAAPSAGSEAGYRGGDCTNNSPTALHSAFRAGFLVSSQDSHTGFRTVRRAGK